MGDFEKMILMALLRLKDDAYGVTIRQEISKRTGKDVSIGALYTSLERLKKKGFISSKDGEATPERGGRRKKYFSLNSSGSEALSKAMNNLNSMYDGLDSKLLPGLLGGGN